MHGSSQGGGGRENESARVGEGKGDPGGRCGAPGFARAGVPGLDPRMAARCGG